MRHCTAPLSCWQLPWIQCGNVITAFKDILFHSSRWLRWRHSMYSTEGQSHSDEHVPDHYDNFLEHYLLCYCLPRVLRGMQTVLKLCADCCCHREKWMQTMISLHRDYWRDLRIQVSYCDDCRCIHGCLTGTEVWCWPCKLSCLMPWGLV